MIARQHTTSVIPDRRTHRPPTTADFHASSVDNTDVAVGSVKDAMLAHLTKYRTILNVAKEYEGIKHEPCIKRLDIGFIDLPNVDINDFIAPAIKYIVENLMLRRPVLVHCAQGISRSVAIATAFFMWLNQENYASAFLRVRIARQEAEPNIGFSLALNATKLSELDRNVLACFPEESRADVIAWRSAFVEEHPPTPIKELRRQLVSSPVVQTTGNLVFRLRRGTSTEH